VLVPLVMLWVLLTLVERRFSVRRPAELETAPMKSVSELNEMVYRPFRRAKYFLTDDGFVYIFLGQTVFPALMWIFLVGGTPAVLDAVGITFNHGIVFGFSLFFWTFTLMIVGQSGYFSASSEIEEILLNRLYDLEDINRFVMYGTVRTEISRWWFFKKKEFWGSRQNTSDIGAGDYGGDAG